MNQCYNPTNFLYSTDRTNGKYSTDTNKGISEENEKGHVLDDPLLDPSLSESSSKKNKGNKKKIVVTTGKMTHQTHRQATILILPMTVITDTSYTKRIAIIKSIRSNYAYV